MRKISLCILFLLLLTSVYGTILLDVPPYVGVNETTAFRATCTYNSTLRNTSNGLIQIILTNVTYNLTYDTPNLNWKANVLETQERDENEIFMCWNSTDIYNGSNVENASFYVKYRIAFNTTFNLYRSNTTLSDSNRLFGNNFVYLYLNLINASDRMYNYSYTLSGDNSDGFIRTLTDMNLMNKIGRLTPYYRDVTITSRPKDSRIYFWGKLTNGIATIKLYEIGDYQLHLVENKVTGDTMLREFERPEFGTEDTGFDQAITFNGKKAFNIANKNQPKEFNILMDYFEVIKPIIYKNFLLFFIVLVLYFVCIFLLIKVFNDSPAIAPMVKILTSILVTIIFAIIGRAVI